MVATGYQPWYASSPPTWHTARRQAHEADGLCHAQAVTKRAGRKKDSATSKSAAAGGGGQKAQFAKKAVFESTKKKEVGVSDLTLISKISNEAINDNLKKRFENAEIYVCRMFPHPTRWDTAG